VAYFSDAYFTDRFERSYGKLHPNVQRQCDEAVKQVFEDPTYRGLKAKPIKPSKIYWEARINRADRLVYKPEATEVYFMDIVCHDELSKYE
jgi:Txe/YoeB family toxin of Txe-Axe toxin-antitoxin module